MKNRTIKKLNRHGMSLAEVLVVVALIAILGSVTTIEVVKYRRSMKQLELDGWAKEIFMAAQNNLSLAKSQNLLGCTEFGTPENAETGEDGVCYYILGPSYEALSDHDSLISHMLPFGSIEDTVRTGGSYVVRYHKDSGTVLDVFYALCEGNRYGHDFTSADYPELCEENRAFGGNDIVVGYYGGADPRATGGGIVNQRLREPSLTLSNGDTLSASITNPNAAILDEDDSFVLLIEGETSKQTKTIDLSAFKGVSSFSYVLDGVRTGENHFAELTAGSGLIPGEDIIVKIVVEKGTEGTVTARAESQTAKSNSLYANLDLSTKTAGIASFRHLENLSKDISALGDTIDLQKAEQYTDLKWTSFANDTVSVRKVSGEAGTTGCYLPVTFTPGAVYYNGANHVISDVKISTAGNAGLFGDFTGGRIENLTLENFDVTSTGASAGALAGTLSNTTVQNVLVYNNRTTLRTEEYNLGITAASDAGGLAGRITDSTIAQAAAAVYVKAAKDGSAGGFAGSISGSTITECYSGGHTYTGKYRTSLGEDGADAWGKANVISMLGTAGGFIGTAAGSSVSVCYSTASAFGYVPAGFIGTAGGEGMSVMNCYSTGYVHSLDAGNPAVQAFAGGTAAAGGNTFVLNGNYAVSTVAGVSAIEADSDFYIKENDIRAASAYYYDDTLLSKYRGKYSYPTIKLLGGTGSGKITEKHFGDWQVPSGKIVALDYDFINSETLYLKINVSDVNADGENYSDITLLLQGAESKKDVALKISLNYESGVPAPSISKVASSVNGQFDWANGNETLKEKLSARTSIVEEGGKKYVVLTLDDISTAGGHFNEIFGNTEGSSDGVGFIRGENIKSYIVKGQVSGLGAFKNIEEITQNSLYAQGSDSKTGTALLSNVRHLQNLEPMVSGVSEEEFFSAELTANIAWTERNIYNADSSGSTANAFYPVYNHGITVFDGNGHTITGVPFAGASISDGKLVSGSGDSGLFRLIDNGMNIHDLRLDNCTANTSSGNAGMLAAKITNDNTAAGMSAKITTVLVTGKAGNNVTASAGAGGLIGYLDADLTMANSAASVIVSGNNAGGLIGKQAGGSYTLNQCFAGGHTDTDVYGEVKYDLADYNVTGYASAGGIAGVVESDASISLYQTFNAASVDGNDRPAGGIIGELAGTGSFNEVYTIAPVAGTKVTQEADEDCSEVSGAFIGDISGSVIKQEKTYYLPEVFEGNVSDESTSSVVTVGTGKLKNEVKLAYYEKDKAGNAISAKLNNETMQIRTYPYNSTLIVNGYGSNNEFPFSIWTSFDFDDPAENHGTYYGDWQPINPHATVQHQVTFKYQNPYTGAVITCKDPNLTLQKIKERQDNRLLTPYVEPFAGYQIEVWELRKGTDDPDSTPLAVLTPADGYVTIPKEYSKYDLVLTARHKKLDNFFVVFYYDMTHTWYDNFAKKGTTEYQELVPEKLFTQIGSSLEVDPADNLKFADVKVPSRIINGYSFEGWYYDPQFEYPIDFTSTDVLSPRTVDGKQEDGIKAYAKYSKTEFYTVTIDFFYMTEEGELTELKSIPRYSYDGVAQYKIRCIKGTTFNQEVKVPVPAGALKLEYADYYNTAEGASHHGSISMVTNPSASVTGSCYDDRVHVTATDSERFIMVYLARPDNLVKYKIVYRLQESETTAIGAIGITVDDLSDKETLEQKINYNKVSFVDVLCQDELYAPAGTKPQVIPTYIKGFMLPETADIYNYEDAGTGIKRLDPLLAEEGSYTQTIYVDYYRDEYVLTFDSRKGSYIEPVLLKYGEPLIQKQPEYPVLAGYAPDLTKGGSGSTFKWETVPGGSYTGTRYRDKDGHTTTENGDGLYGKVRDTYVPLLCEAKTETVEKSGKYTGDRYVVNSGTVYNNSERYGFYNGEMVTIYRHDDKWWRTRTGKKQKDYQYSNEYNNTVYDDSWFDTEGVYGIVDGTVKPITYKSTGYYSGEWTYSYQATETTYTYSYTSFEAKVPVECPGGWIIVDDGTPYTEGMEYKYTWIDTMPANDLIAYITWAEATANYTVIYWKQDVNDNKNAANDQKTYLVDKIVTKTAKTNSQVTGSTLQKPADNKNDSTFGDYIGFEYNKVNSDTGAKTIAPDGTTTFNIRYDRKLITMHFKDENEEYEGGVSDKKTVTIGGVTYDLYQKADGKYYYKKTNTYFKEYTGDRYVKGYDCNVYYDAIGITDKGKEVAIEYTWHNGKGKGYKWYQKGENTAFKGTAYYQKSAYGMYYRKAYGQFERLETNGYQVGFWVTEEQEIEYTGTLPEGEKIKSPFTGLYGQSLAQNGYQWPVITSGNNKYVWKDGNTIMSYLGQFVLNPRTDAEVTFVKDTTSSATIYFYLEDENGNYVYDAQGVVSGSNNGFTLSNKYDGYQFRYWKKEYPGNKFNTSGATKIEGYQEEGSVSGSYTNLSIAFERKEVALSFYNTTDNKVCTEPGFESTKVKFGKSLESKLSAMKSLELHAADPSYVWDGNFYLDSTCETLCDIQNIRMPQTALTLYLKFILPNHYISFDLNDTDDVGNRPEPASYKGETELDRQNIIVVENQTITSKVASEVSEGNFEWLDAFIPERKKVADDGTVEYEYTFRGWYYDKDGVETKFILGQGIKEDIDLYAVWKKGPPTEYGTIIERYIYKDAEGKETILAPEKTITNVEVGVVTELWAEDLEGFWPNEMVKYTVVKSADKDENVTFYYNKIQPWKYDVEYYAVYDSLTTLTNEQKAALGISPASAPSIYKISQPKDAASFALLQTENVQAYNNYESIPFKMPLGFERYSLVGYTFEEFAEEEAAGLPKPAAISDSSYKTRVIASDLAVIGDPGNWVDPDDPNHLVPKKGLLRFYITLDETKTDVSDRYSVYNGLSQSDKDALEEAVAISEPDNTTKVALRYLYSYYKPDGTKVQASSIVDAGAYKMNAWVLAEVGSGDTKKTYVLWQNISKTLNLRINPRPITVTSGNATRVWQKDNPLTCSEMTITGPNDGYGTTMTDRDKTGRLDLHSFIGTDGKDAERFTYAFSVEAFRQDYGKAQNSFTWEFVKKNPEDDLARIRNNYNIITVFGDLVIPWYYTAEYHAVYDSLVSLTEEEKTELGITLSEKKDMLLGSVNGLPADSKNVEVSCNFPQEETSPLRKYWSSYLPTSWIYKQGENTVKTGTGNKAAIAYHQTAAGKLEIYASADPAKAVLANRSRKADGRTQAEMDAAETPVIIPAPEGYTAQITRVYRYYDNHGQRVEASSITEAGTFYVDAYSLLTLTHTESGEQSVYLLSKKADQSLTLTVNK